MITKEQMQAFYEQLLQEKGMDQLLKEAAQWAKKNGLITQEKFLAMSKEEQRKTMMQLTKAYSRSLMTDKQG